MLGCDFEREPKGIYSACARGETRLSNQNVQCDIWTEQADRSMFLCLASECFCILMFTAKLMQKITHPLCLLS